MKESEKRNRKSFLHYVQNEIELLKLNGHYGVAKNRQSAFTCLRAYLLYIGKENIPFQKLNAQFVCGFEHWLLHVRGVCRNTSSFYIRSLQASFNKAVDDGLATGNPFTGVYRGVEKTRKRAVPPSVIRNLQGLDIRHHLHQLYQREHRRDHGIYFEQTLQNLLFARDLFVFSFCMRGMPFVDMAYLRKSDVRDGYICYARRKTHQQLAVRIEPPAQQILDRWHSKSAYLLPILTNTGKNGDTYEDYRNMLTQYNRHLRVLGGFLGGIRLTSYVSRHSWATSARDINIPLSVISQSLGHDSELTTRIYLQELDNSIIDRANSQLLNAVLKGKSKKIQGNV